MVLFLNTAQALGLFQGPGLLSFYSMNEDIKNNIIIIALDNLVKNYSIALEEAGTTLNNEDKETIQFIVDSAALILGEYSSKVINPKPEWNKILP